MKKIIILVLCLIFVLAACKPVNEPSDVQSGAISDNSENNTAISNQDKTSTNEDETKTDNNNKSSTDEQESNDPYPMIDISDERIKIADNKKVFSDLGITFSFPVDWIGVELRAEDSSSYSFRHPEFENACFNYHITGAVYLYDVPNEDEYIKKLSDPLENLKIHSFTKDTLSGYECTKVVYSYTSEDTEFILINYEYVIVGSAWYGFSIKYPSAQSETYEGVFESIVNSIVFKG